MVILIKFFMPHCGIAIWPFVFIREKDFKLTLLTHETIHLKQQQECLVVFAYLWFIVELFIKSIYYKSVRKGYLNVSFEREAFINQFNTTYLFNRKPYAFLDYVYFKHTNPNEKERTTEQGGDSE